MKVCAIAAMTRNGVIGAGDDLAIRAKVDMAHFRAVTTGELVIVGYRTWMSILKNGNKGLPGRRVILVSRRLAPLPNQAVAPGLHNPLRVESIVHDVASALSFAKQAFNADKVFVIGGAKTYAEAAPFVEELHLNRFDMIATVENPVYFPAEAYVEFGIDREECWAGANRIYEGELGIDVGVFARQYAPTGGFIQQVGDWLLVGGLPLRRSHVACAVPNSEGIGVMLTSGQELTIPTKNSLDFDAFVQALIRQP